MGRCTPPQIAGPAGCGLFATLDPLSWFLVFNTLDTGDWKWLFL